MRDLDTKKFGLVLRHLRREQTLEEVSSGAGVPFHTYQRLEKGAIDKPTFEDIVKIGKYHGLSPNQMAALADFWVLPEQEQNIPEPQVQQMMQAIRVTLGDLPAHERTAFAEIISLVVHAFHRRALAQDPLADVSAFLPEWARNRS